AQQHTLNAALGNLGGRQKSWMTSGTVHSCAHNVRPPIVKRRTQPPKKPTEPVPQPQPHTPSIPASPTVESSSDRHPPSNSTSPQLANVLSHQVHRSPLPSPNVVLPSPAPSDETSNELVLTRALPDNNDGTMMDRRWGGGDSVGSLAEPRENLLESYPLYREEQQEIAISPKRPMESTVFEASTRRHLGAHQTHQGSLLSSNHTSRSLQYHHGRNPPTPTQTSEMPWESPVAYGNNTHSVRHSSHSRPQSLSTSATPPQPQGAFGPPRNWSRESAQHTYGSPLGNHATLPQGQSTTPMYPLEPLEYFTQRHCSDVFGAFVATWKPSFMHQRDQGRLNVLKEAVEKADFAYLTLHQTYCLLDLDSGRVPESIRTHPGFNSALKLMNEVLATNEALSPRVLRFFADFPMPVEQISANWPQKYNYEQHLLLNFISRASNHSNLSLACERRLYPPLVRELLFDLGVHSFLFQKIIFTAILRRIFSKIVPGCPTPPNLEDQANALLTRNQSDHRQREIHRPPNPSMDYEAQERTMEHQQWGTQLRHLCEHFIQQTLSERSAAQTMTPPTQTQVQMQPRQLSHGQQSIRPAPVLTSFDSVGQLHVPSVPSNHGAEPLVTQEPLRLQHQPRHLLPNRGVTQPQPVQPRPDRSALHLAHLRSPVLRSQLKDTKLFSFVKRFAKPPTRLDSANEGIHRWTLSISAGDLRTIPTDVPGLPGEPPVRIINQNTQLFRLRCVKWAELELLDEHKWVVADTSWIPYTYFTFNGMSLHARKKLHHGKDLPIDLSSFIKEGDNTLEIAVLHNSDDQSYRNYLFAVEVVAAASDDTIKELCLNNRIPAAETISAIKRRLSGTNDDEISILQDNLTINLFDPFSASAICNTPVRGKACLHHDCFDLDTFLQTRRRKGDASDPDQWKCPICNADARPQSLVKDGFLESVRCTLAQQGLLKTRAIIIDKDGNWKPRVEVLEGVAD
ncbi:hypothetical protein BCR34DRAFT_449639, partial [Clohesyomyces aquaticus]